VAKRKGGAEPAIVEKLRREGKLRVFNNMEEARAARKERMQRTGIDETTTPAHLLPEDHYRKRKRYTITLSKDAHAIAKKVANGNVSRGIENALLHWHDCPRTDRRRRK
jgi:hypothetical protein